jgi:hypothetical protein
VFFLTPTEVNPPEVVLAQRRILASWTTEELVLTGESVLAGASYVRA